jgi:hypothetical protein
MGNRGRKIQNLVYFRRFRKALKRGIRHMLTIHVVQARLGYGIDYIKFRDEEGLVVYLLARGVTDDNILKALKGLGREGAYTIQQEELFVSPRESVVKEY